MSRLIPAAGLVLALMGGGTTLAYTSFASDDAPAPLPTVGYGKRADVPTTAELESRVDGAMKAMKARHRLRLQSARTGIQPHIIGGTDTTITSAPWMVQLWYSDPDTDTGFFCGGVLVSPSKVVTAGHCVAGADWTRNGAVVVGTDQLPPKDADGTYDLSGLLSQGKVDFAYRQWLHPSYGSTANGGADNDIAVLTLDLPVASGTARPLPLTTAADTASYAAGTSAKVYGWGDTTSGGDLSQTLRTATLPIDSDATCSGTYPEDFTAGHMVCAGKPATGDDATTITTGSGDSGGPLVVRGKLVGIVSWGADPCSATGAYGVFTKVGHYVGATEPRVDDPNLSADSKADLFLRSSNGHGYEKDSKGTSFGARIDSGSWSSVNAVVQADLNKDDFQDFLVRYRSTGDVYWLYCAPPPLTKITDPEATCTSKSKRIASSWGSRKRILVPGDVTGDSRTDLLSVDSGGYLWIYPGKGDGTFSTRVEVGPGWAQYDSLRGHGDLTGDGVPDLIARKDSNGYIYLYKGTLKPGTSAFTTRSHVRTWSSYDAFDAVGDVTGDGRADWMARRGSDDATYLYPGTGKAGEGLFATRIKQTAAANLGPVQHLGVNRRPQHI